MNAINKRAERRSTPYQIGYHVGEVTGKASRFFLRHAPLNAGDRSGLSDISHKGGYRRWIGVNSLSGNDPYVTTRILTQQLK
jgi:hypothetical protein